MESKSSSLNDRPGFRRPPYSERLERFLYPIDRLFNRIYGSPYNPIYQSGQLVVGLLLVMIVTGIYLVIFYETGNPYQSVSWINDQVWHGRWIRSLHRYTADGALLAAMVHMFRMLLQGRNWGPRIISWFSGLILVGILLLCGWTGMVMAWDLQSFLIGSEGAKLIDMVPLFSEPISRTFIDMKTLGAKFFFFNLVGHMALPVGLGFILWLHTVRLTRPQVLPPKKMYFTIILVIFAFSIVWPLKLQPEADILALTGEIKVDLIFAFWLPISQNTTPMVHLFLWIGLGLFLFSLPFWWRPRPELKTESSFVNKDLCTGCAQCSLDCPKGAIIMVPRNIEENFDAMAIQDPSAKLDMVALVDPGLCVSCGICAGSCAPMQVGPPGRLGRDQIKNIEEFLTGNNIGGDDILLFVCSQGIGMHREFHNMEGIYPYPAHCAGGIHTSVIELALRQGVGGVHILSCPPRNCLYREGPKWLHERIYNDREAELKDRVDKRRVRISHIDYSDFKMASAEIKKFRAFLGTLPKSVKDSTPMETDPGCETKEEVHG